MYPPPSQSELRPLQRAGRGTTGRAVSPETVRTRVPRRAISHKYSIKNPRVALRHTRGHMLVRPATVHAERSRNSSATTHSPLAALLSLHSQWTSIALLDMPGGALHELRSVTSPTSSVSLSASESISHVKVSSALRESDWW